MGQLPPPPPLEHGVTEWQISEPIATPDTPLTTLPADLEWKTVRAEPDGLLNFDRFVERPDRNALIFVRLVLEASSPTTQPLTFGASDVATVFRDGRPIFTSNASYSFDAKAC